MSRSLNKVMLIGNVGQDPEIRTANTGNRFASFSLATGRQWTGSSGDKQEKTEWHRCVVWNAKGGGAGLVDVVEKYVRKGERIYVEGQIEYRTYQDKENQTKYVTEIRVRELMLLGTRGGAGSSEGDSMGNSMGSGSRSGGGSRSGAPSRAGSAAGTGGSRPSGAAAGGEGGGGGAGQSGSDDFEDFPGALEDEADDLPF